MLFQVSVVNSKLAQWNYSSSSQIKVRQNRVNPLWTKLLTWTTNKLFHSTSFSISPFFLPCFSLCTPYNAVPNKPPFTLCPSLSRAFPWIHNPIVISCIRKHEAFQNEWLAQPLGLRKDTEFMITSLAEKTVIRLILSISCRTLLSNHSFFLSLSFIFFLHLPLLSVK